MEYDSGDESKIVVMGHKGNLSKASTSSCNHASNSEISHNVKERDALFHIRIIDKHTKIDTLFDSVSQVYLIFEQVVKKLGLEIKTHPKPYPLGWVVENSQLQVTQQCNLKFAITSKFIDEVVLDVIPLDICGIVLGSPYLYDRKDIFFREENKYHLKKDGVEYIVRSHKVKTSLSLVNTGQIKRLINSSKSLVLLMVKEKENDKLDSFKGCDPKHQDEIVKLITNYSEVFQTSKGLLPKREIAHEIYLQQDAPLPNISMYKLSVIENEEIKKTVQDLLENGII